MGRLEERTVDPAALEMLKHAEERGMETVWDRCRAQEPLCGFGNLGLCCRICLQGPCRIDPFGEGATRGICGATDYSIVARNLIRSIVGGTAAHSDHGRHVAITLLAHLDGHAPDYRIADPAKAEAVARRIGLDTAGKTPQEITREITIAALRDFSRLEETPCTWVTSTVTPGMTEKFEECAIMPSNINGAIAEVMHRSTMGVDADPINLIFGGLKSALADYAGCHLSTDLTDILIGTPRPVRSHANLGVIDPDKVNITVHGHIPLLSEIVVDVAREMEDEARAAGAAGINVVGICCAANEVLMRKGIPHEAHHDDTVLKDPRGISRGLPRREGEGERPAHSEACHRGLPRARSRKGPRAAGQERGRSRLQPRGDTRDLCVREPGEPYQGPRGRH